MRIFRCSLLMAVSVATLCGCHPRFTHVPDLFERSPEQYRTEWTYHDPFPDDTSGPTVDHRPPGGLRQRTMTRSALEKDSMTFRPRGAFEPPRPEARLNPKTANVVQP
jgi:hypothetical protein